MIGDDNIVLGGMHAGEIGKVVEPPKGAPTEFVYLDLPGLKAGCFLPTEVKFIHPGDVPRPVLSQRDRRWLDFHLEGRQGPLPESPPDARSRFRKWLDYARRGFM